MGTLKSYVLRMEEKCKYHEDEISRRKEHLKETSARSFILAHALSESTRFFPTLT